MLLGCTEWVYEHKGALNLILNIAFNLAFIRKYVDDDDNDDNHVVL